MSQINTAITRTIELARQLPSPSSVDEIQKTEFDEHEFVKATTMRPSADKLIAFLLDFLQPEFEQMFSELPIAVTKMICEELAKTQAQIQQALNALMKPSNPNEVKRDTPKQTYRSWADNLDTHLAELHRILSPTKLEHKLKKLDVVELQRIFQDHRREVEELSRKVTNTKEEVLEQLTAKQKSVETTALAAENLAELDDAVRVHEESSRKWLLVFIGVGIFTLCLLIWVTVEGQKLFIIYGPIFGGGNSLDVTHVLSRAIGKILIASFALGLCLITARNYQTHVHNVIVNRQRRIAMLAFHRLYKSIDAADKDSRHNLVVQAAQAIFVHGSTGFLPKSGNEFMPYGPIIAEALKGKS